MVSPERSRVLAILWRLPVPSRRIAPRFCVTPSVYLGVYLGPTSTTRSILQRSRWYKEARSAYVLDLKRFAPELLNSIYAFVLYYTATSLR